MADDYAKRREDAKRLLEQQRDARTKELTERTKHRGKPTPTQMENDLAALGHNSDLEPDGSEVEKPVTRQIEPVHAGTYQTRQVAAPPRARQTET